MTQGGSYTSVFLILLGVSLTPAVLCRTVYYVQILFSMFKNSAVTWCLYWHYLGRINLILKQF